MSKTKIERKRRFRITEKQRTVVLLILIAFAIGFIYWIQSGIDSNFVETL